MKFAQFLTPAVALGAVQIASAQISFSIDYKGPTKGAPGCLMPLPITEGDILSPCTPGGMPAFGLLPPPAIVVPAGVGPGTLGLLTYPGCAGTPPGVPCGVEVDALSFSFDGPVMNALPPGSWKFSVNQYATGLPSPAPPSVFSESPAPIGEAASDVFIDFMLPPGLIPCGMLGVFGNTAMVDGNGLAGPSPFAYPGTGLIEPNSRAFGIACALPDMGDNLDALDFGPRGPVAYFSLDGIGPDVCGFPRGASGPLNGFAPGAVLAKVIAAGGVPAVYAAPAVLGLDLMGPFTDDLDALVLFENGMPGFQASPAPYVWAPFAPFDTLVFSVTATSAVVGAPDSRCGIPIMPGDLLIPPIVGGMSPFPAILIYAENLGLATLRTGGPTNDDLDALDCTRLPVFDCNGNGMEDVLDLAMGAPDCNGNGVIDTCEYTLSSYCTAGTTSSGCTATLSAAGTPSASLSCPFVVTSNGVEGLQSGVFFYGISGATAAPWGTGFLCVKGPLERGGVLASGGTAGGCDGTLVFDFNLWMSTHPGALGQPLYAGEAFWIQSWFRDPPSVKTTAMSDALTFTLAP